MLIFVSKIVSYQALRSPNIYVVTVLNVFATSAANLYLYCMAGARLTTNCIMFSDALFESNWWKMPNHLQKYFILLIAETQKPLFLEGYGIIRITLEAFTKVRPHITQTDFLTQ